MGKLYIIGNGFDKSHCLPTDYKDNLTELLIKNNSTQFKTINHLFFNNEVCLWSEFESRIGNFTPEKITEITQEGNDILQEFHANNSDLYAYGYSPEDENYGDHYTEVDNAIYQASSETPSFDKIFKYSDDFETMNYFLTDGLNEMIENANAQLKNIQPIYMFESDDYFITFNYTNTLEDVYNINPDHILHLHGDKEKIWGNAKKNLKEHDINFDYENYYLDIVEPSDDYPSNLQEFKDAVTFENEFQEDINEQVREIFSNLNSKVLKNLEIDLLMKFIDGIPKNEIVTIETFGHSLGEVDIPYFEEIASCFDSINWKIYYYNNDDVILENVKQLSFRKYIMLDCSANFPKKI